MPLEPLIYRSRYVKIQLIFQSLEMLTEFNFQIWKNQLINVIRIGENLEIQKKQCTFVVFKKTRVLTIPRGI